MWSALTKDLSEFVNVVTTDTKEIISNVADSVLEEEEDTRKTDENGNVIFSSEKKNSNKKVKKGVGIFDNLHEEESDEDLGWGDDDDDDIDLEDNDNNNDNDNNDDNDNGNDNDNDNDDKKMRKNNDTAVVQDQSTKEKEEEEEGEQPRIGTTTATEREVVTVEESGEEYKLNIPQTPSPPSKAKEKHDNNNNNNIVNNGSTTTNNNNINNTPTMDTPQRFDTLSKDIVVLHQRLRDSEKEKEEALESIENFKLIQNDFENEIKNLKTKMDLLNREKEKLKTQQQQQQQQQISIVTVEEDNEKVFKLEEKMLNMETLQKSLIKDRMDAIESKQQLNKELLIEKQKNQEYQISKSKLDQHIESLNEKLTSSDGIIEQNFNLSKKKIQDLQELLIVSNEEKDKAIGELNRMTLSFSDEKCKLQKNKEIEIENIKKQFQIEKEKLIEERDELLIKISSIKNNLNDNDDDSVKKNNNNNNGKKTQGDGGDNHTLKSVTTKAEEAEETRKLSFDTFEKLDADLDEDNWEDWG